MYTVNQFAEDLGRTVNPALEPVLKKLHEADQVQWLNDLRSTLAESKKQHAAEVASLKSEIEEMQREFLAGSAETRREYEHRLRAVIDAYEARLRESRRYFDASTYPVTLPYSGQVPEVLEGCRLPLLRIRWQEGQPNGEGEAPVPAGWVLDDDQAGTWLDYVNGRSIQS